MSYATPRSPFLHALLGALLWPLALCAQPESRLPVPSYEPYANAMHHGVPAWSADDREVFFNTIGLGQGDGHIYRVPSAGGATTRFISDDKWSANAAWSPDGKRIAFAWQGPDGKRIWTADPSGSNLRQVSHGVFGIEMVPNWSPDGSRIAYVSAGPRGEQVMIAGADGSPAKLFAKGVRPRHSPDGKFIAYTARVENEAAIQSRPDTWVWGVFLKPADGGEARLLASSTGTIRGWASGMDWSPDGRQIVYVRHLGGAAGGGSELIMIDAAKDRIDRRIAIDGTVLDPAWSHDGKRIAFMLQSTSHAGEVHVVELPDGKATALTRQTQQGSSRLIFYESSGGIRIPAFLFEPPSGKRNAAGLVWLHGGAPGTGSVDNMFDAGIWYFVDQGYTVLEPNYRGSIGWSPEVTAVSSPREILSDIEAGARFLAREGVRRDAIGLVGFSFGGCLALLSAATYPDSVTAVVDFFGATDLAAVYRDSIGFRAVMERLLAGTPDQVPEAYRAASPVSCAGKIRAPVLILHGTADNVMPYKHSTAMADALTAAGKQVRLLTFGSGHGFPDQDNLKAYPEVAAFLAANLLSK